MKNLFIDVETTGILAWDHSVIQIAAMIELDKKIIDQITLNIAPITGSKIDDEALKVTGKTLDIIYAYPSASEQLEVFMSFLKQHVDPYNKQDKLFFVAYNAPFDYEFMRAFFKRQDNNFFGSYFWNPPLDVMTLSLHYLQKERASMPNFKLFTVAETLGISVDKEKLHDAYYDIDLTYQIYRHMFPMLDGSTQKTYTIKESNMLKTEEFKETLF